MIDNPTALERTILESIPMARAMGMTVLDYDGHRLAVAAPLAPNINDKGCAFGGSMFSAMTLAAWGLITLKLGEHDMEADVFIAESTIRYLEPVWDELVAEAAVEADQSWEDFLQDYTKRGKARILIAVEMSSATGGGVACKMTAKFVAKRGGR